MFRPRSFAVLVTAALFTGQVSEAAFVTSVTANRGGEYTAPGSFSPQIDLGNTTADYIIWERATILATLADLDAEFGSGNWEIQSVVLRISEATMSSMSMGDLDIYHTNTSRSLLGATPPADIALVWSGSLSPTGVPLTKHDQTLFDGSSENPLDNPALQDMLAGGELTLYLAPGAGLNAKFLGGESARLIVTAVPTPGTVALATVGLLAGVRRRR